MARARNSLPRELRHLSFNTATGFYEAEEAGILYQLTFEQMNDLKTYYHSTSGYIPTFEKWYNNLSSGAKKNVKRIGAKPPPDDFFPDAEYD